MIWSWHNVLVCYTSIILPSTLSPSKSSLGSITEWFSPMFLMHHRNMHEQMALLVPEFATLIFLQPRLSGCDAEYWIDQAILGTQEPAWAIALSAAVAAYFWRLTDFEVSSMLCKLCIYRASFLESMTLSSVSNQASLNITLLTSNFHRST